MRRPLTCLPAVLLAVTLCPAAQVLAVEPSGEGQLHGMDVLGAVDTVKKWIGPTAPVPLDKPWAKDLADLTNANAAVYAKAIRNLIIAGERNPQVLTDLAVLATDRDWQLRSRVLRVCAGIGGTSSAPLLLQFSNDNERRIRELAALGLGQATGEGVYERLIVLLIAPESEIRQAAAGSLGALGDLRALEPLTRQEQEPDDLVKRAMRESLTHLANRPDGVTTAVVLLGQLKDLRRDALLEAVVDSADRRLCPVVASIAANPGRDRAIEASSWTQFLAVRSLAACGDYRAVPVLIELVDGDANTEIRASAAYTLRLVTGYGAAPGKAWRVWATDNAVKVAHLSERDTLLATIEDPTTTISRAELAPWTIAELAPLTEGVLGRPVGRITPWWPSRALAALRADDHDRWTTQLVLQINGLPSSDVDSRIGLLMLLDDLSAKDDIGPLTEVLKNLKQRLEDEADKAKETSTKPPDHDAEIELLTQALGRRGVKTHL